MTAEISALVVVTDRLVLKFTFQTPCRVMEKLPRQRLLPVIYKFFGRVNYLAGVHTLALRRYMKMT
jgi:hypothetical protein